VGVSRNIFIQEAILEYLEIHKSLISLKIKKLDYLQDLKFDSLHPVARIR
jgi:hypothetical protein